MPIMLEPLVPSKVRRKVLEHLLAHPQRRVYLRGLARELGLTVSPVHRELKRLERFGVLKAFHEANVCFYVTDETCPLLAQLKQAGPNIFREAPEGPKPTSELSAASPVQARLSWSMLVGALSLGIVLGIGIVSTLMLTNRQLLALTKTAALTPRTSQLPAAYEARGGEMRSARLRLVPGMVGGFNPPGLSEESY